MNLKMLVATIVLVFSTCVVTQETGLQGAVDLLTARLENTSDTIAVPAVNIDLLSLVRLAAKDELKEETIKLRQGRQAALLGRTPFPTSHLDTVELGGKKYFFSKKQHMTWINAVSFCRLYGMELTSIETREEDQLIAAHLKSIEAEMNLKMLVATIVLVFSVCVFSQEPGLQGAVERLTARFENTSDTIAVPAVNIDLLSLVRLAAKDELKEETIKLRQGRKAALMGRTPFPTSHLDTVELGGKKYFFSKKQLMTWIDAVSFCRLYGMELTSIETREEDQLIAAHLKSIGMVGSYVYISGNKIGHTSYLWINGDHLIYENWHAGNPAQFLTEHCMAHLSGAWVDYPCHAAPSAFICEEP